MKLVRLNYRLKILRNFLLVLTGAFLFCFGIMFVVNYFSSPPTHEKHSYRCTRYCHDHGCLHVENRYSGLNNCWMLNAAGALYKGNIALLGKIPGLTYKQANILIYVICFPLLWLFLIMLVLGQRGQIRALKNSIRESQRAE